MSVAREWDDGRGLVLFIHGLWMNASSWDPWVEEFDGNGYDSINYRWPGEQQPRIVCRSPSRPRPRPGRTADRHHRCDRQAAHRIGHGMGGLLAQVLVGQGSAGAAISLAPVPAGWPPRRLAPARQGIPRASPGPPHELGW